MIDFVVIRLQSIQNFEFVNFCSQCSVSCGGGVRQRDVLCLNGTGGGSISEIFCQHLQRPNVTEACHQLACQPYNWISGNWTAVGQIHSIYFKLFQLI